MIRCSNILRIGRGVVCVEIEPASLQGSKVNHQIRLVLETVTSDVYSTS